MYRYLILSLLLLIPTAFTHAQPYVEGGNTRHRFAQLTLGADLMFLPSQGDFSYLVDGSLQTSSFPTSLIPRFQIGGTHFWGHAEFYVAFPVGSFLSGEIAPDVSVGFSPGVETAFKLYPWRIQRGRVAPYIGSGFNVVDFVLRHEEGRGPFVGKTLAPFTLGATFQKGNFLFDLGARYQPSQAIDYPVSRTTTATVEMPDVSLVAGVRWMLETTLSAEKPYQNGQTDKVVELMGNMKRLSGFSFAVAPSASFVIGGKRSTYNQAERSYIGRHRGSGVFIDAGIGYYFHKPDAHLNLAYRRYRSVTAAYGTGQSMRRSAFTLEAYKFLGDFHGFVPFIGPSVGLENWTLRDFENGEMVYEQPDQRVLPGLTFGWDIRPDKAQWFILRTNLRYTPYRMQTPGDSFLFHHQLEFNFIQLVIYPGRKAALKKIYQ